MKTESRQEIKDKRKNIICQLVEDDCYVPMKEKELAIFMQVKPEEREELKEVLSELVRERKLVLTKRGKYIKGEEGQAGITGTFISNARGFGFVEVEGREQDLFIPEDGINGAFHKDTVLVELLPEQHFTQPPAHFTEASLVKTLEELGIGRPSTYAPTITTLISRRYVAKEKKNLYLSELGDIVNQIMVSAFPSIVDVNFTATMEALLDGVAEGNVEWKTIVRNFYPDLEKAVNHAEEALEKIKIEDEVTDVICDLCGRNMVIKYGPHGKFLACPGFPECRNTKPYYEKTGVKCPKCGGEIVIKKTQKGRRYYGCENNPECDVMTWQRPSGEICPKCGNMMLEKGNRLVCADSACGYLVEKQKK